MIDPLIQSQVIPYLERLSKFGVTFVILSCEEFKNYILHKKDVEKIIKSVGLKWTPIFYDKKPPKPSTLYDVHWLQRKVWQLQSLLLSLDLPVYHEVTINNAIFFDVEKSMSWVISIKKNFDSKYNLNELSIHGVDIAKKY